MLQTLTHYINGLINGSNRMLTFAIFYKLIICMIGIVVKYMSISIMFKLEENSSKKIKKSYCSIEYLFNVYYLLETAEAT